MDTKPRSTARSKSATTTTKASSVRPKPSGELKLNLACGDRPIEGFKNVDKYKTASTDQLVDLLKFPWPWKDNSVDEVACHHFFEHIPGPVRPKFMDELYRVMKPGAKASIIVPYGQSNRAMQDFTHAWPPVIAESFLYFNKGWRETNKLTHGEYSMKCDFDFGYGYVLDSEVQLKSQETQAFAIKHYVNSAVDLHLTLTKRS